ncbi:MAG: hypothetical protein ISF22_10085 [Methanomassiliicoccus sp.]|nr:hypothetical protein [Methanomassiliicoccus sp.]
MDLADLEERARTSGEAFMTLAASERSRLGVAARCEDGRLSLSVEGQILLLPAGPEVDLDWLGRAGKLLASLRAMGFDLFHYGDGWVVASRPADGEDLSAAAEEAARLLRSSY